MLSIHLLSLCLLSCAAQGPNPYPNAGIGIEQALNEFYNIQDSTRTKVWWFHGEGPTTREGITADLEAYKQAGVGGVIYYDQVHGDGKGALEAFCPEWWEALKFSAQEARRLSLSFEINISNGYVAGGPWIDESNSMKTLCSTDMLVHGGKRQKLKMKAPTERWYRDIALLAFPVKSDDWREYSLNEPLELDSPITVRSITYNAPKSRKSRVGAMQYPNGAAEKFYGMGYVYSPDAGVLECSDDGVTYRTVCSLPFCGGTGGSAQKTIAFPEVSARYFRIRRIEGQISNERISSKARPDRWEEKAGYFPEFNEGDFTPQYFSGTIPADSVLDLTSLMDSDGNLEWDVPQGEWVLMRIAYRSTRGRTKHGRANLMGLECDKLSRDAVKLHWDSYPGRILDTLSKYGLKPVGVTMDSHEAGPQNWTSGFEKLFFKYNSYDITPYLLCTQGYIVNSNAATDKFLRDFRRTIADAIADNYFSCLDSLCRQNGVRFTAQAMGNGLCIDADNIQTKGRPMIPQAEFWARDIHGSYDILECSSAAHMYGRAIASAEAFTDAKYSDSPEKLKMLADFAYSVGINEFVVCASAYQSELDKVPGNVAAGRQYCLNRNNSYWNLSSGFWDYQARCASMMRKGLPVVDILVFLGDNPPVKTLSHRLPEITEGYNFDVCTYEALKMAKVRDGRLCFPSGISYQMLCVTREASLTEEQTQLLKEFENQGLPVFIPQSVQDVVTPCFEPDLGFEYDNTLEDCLRFSHRRLSDADVYFVYKHGSKPFKDKVKLRSGYSDVYLLNPLERGLVRVSDSPELNLELKGNESTFIIVSRPGLDSVAGFAADSFNPNSEALSLNEAGWRISFDARMGGSKGWQRTKELFDWTVSDKENIRYFSGTAVYECSFNYPYNPEGDELISIKAPNCCARVSVNGAACATAWCEPWTVNIGNYLKKGRNTIRIEVANSLYNRMIGDCGKDEEQRYTHSSAELVQSTTPLIPSGLLSVEILH